ncbi:MAG: hypothetical protein LUD03_06885 [Firmicutes bacterium]|nr:hypothetical protein [Bacillota bacterium]
MNYMKQVAEMLGVEPGERFRIEGDEADYWLDTNGLNWIERDVCDTDDTVLVELLVGKKSIVKKPWKPKDGDWYVYDGDWYVYLEVGEELAANRIFLTRIVSRIVSPILHCWHSANVLRHRTKRKRIRTKSSRK